MALWSCASNGSKAILPRAPSYSCPSSAASQLKMCSNGWTPKGNSGPPCSRGTPAPALIWANLGLDLLIPLVTPQAALWMLTYSTLWQYWPSILLKGPSCWGRCIHLKCIHLTSALPGDHGVVSGMQPNCEVAVFINGPLALADEIPFFLSVSVILILGNANAFLFPKYFQKVLQLCLMSKPLSLTGNE
ncbi:hypothetical protein M91_09156 [Bos mutus]|uniref:Uncharacterized protein n=1 Tax=Bos mutus TaxID=72004 RepID=L8IBA6_9CETA|nr:hypothetical protein M91_09156 [Bos mutus]